MGGHSCYRQRRTGERKRQGVRGCIVNANLSVLSVAIVKTGDADIPGLTTDPVPRRLGPKRASHLRKLFNLSKSDDVRQYVIKRPLPVKEGKECKKPTAKAPKIQRLVTPTMLQRKRHRLGLKRRQWTRTVRAQPSTPRSLLSVRRRRRKPRSCAGRGQPRTARAEPQSRPLKKKTDPSSVSPSFCVLLGRKYIC